MIRRFGLLAVVLAGLCASPALAQSTYPTAAGGRVAGVVPLQCDTNGANCVPAGTAGAPAAGAQQVQGNVAAATTDSGNPVKIGGVYNTGYPTLTNGQRGDLRQNNVGAVFTSYSDSAAGSDGRDNSIVNYPMSSSGSVFGLNVNGLWLFNGTAWDRARGDTNGIVVQNGLSSTYWTYASGTAGILSNTTTAVTIKAAAGASVRNYVDSCQINTTAFGAAAPLAIRDGAGGAVIFALSVPTAGFLNPINIVFEVPLRSTANTLLEVVTTTANVTGTAYVNCQGHTGP